MLPFFVRLAEKSRPSRRSNLPTRRAWTHDVGGRAMAIARVTHLSQAHGAGGVVDTERPTCSTPNSSGAHTSQGIRRSSKATVRFSFSPKTPTGLQGNISQRRRDLRRCGLNSRARRTPAMLYLIFVSPSTGNRTARAGRSAAPAGPAGPLGRGDGPTRAGPLGGAPADLGGRRARPAQPGAAPACGTHRTLQAAGRLRLGLAYAHRARR
jgi:hypothetical protein